MNSGPNAFRLLNSRVAKVVFDDKPLPERAEAERRALQRFSAWIEKSDRRIAHAACPHIDRELVGGLSGVTILEIAKSLEARYPEVVASMPTLRGHLERLDLADRASGFFAPQALRALIQALLDDDDGPSSPATS